MWWPAAQHKAFWHPTFPLSAGPGDCHEQLTQVPAHELADERDAVLRLWAFVFDVPAGSCAGS